ncbi:MAG: LCP family protein [Hyphomonadaceae bacterium]|nr:LCP family protein [Clostridia bacterium]
MNVKKYFLWVSIILGIYGVLVGGFWFANNNMTVDSAEVDKPLKQRYNILVMGTDESDLRTDVMFIASFNTEQNTLKILSIPRDTRVQINGRNAKVNEAHAIGKQDLAIKTVKAITGMPIHYYISMNFKGFVNIVDTLGGVDFDVPMNMHYEDPEQNLFIHLNKGMQHLNGKKSEMFVRFRYGYAEGDIGRVKAQQAFLKALVDQKCKPEYLLRAAPLFDSFSKNARTNIKMTDIMQFIPMFKLFGTDSMQAYSLPGESKTMDNLSYFVYDKKQTVALIEQQFTGIGTHVSESPKPSASPASNVGKTKSTTKKSR